MKFLRKFPYWQLIAVPLLAIFIGAASNQLVLVANHGKFPVMMNEDEISLFCGDAKSKDESVPDVACAKGGQFIDPVHSIMGPNSHLKPLADIWKLGDATYSIGDFFIMFGEWASGFAPLMWLVLTIRKLYSLID